MKFPKSAKAALVRNRNGAIAAARVAVCAALAFSPVHLRESALQNRTPTKKHAAKSAPATPPAPKPVPAPFRAGEVLDFSGQWLGMSGAITAQLSIPEQRAVYGKDAWHFRGQMHTNNPLRYLLAADDEFDAYDTANGLTGLQFEMYLHESGKSDTRLLRMVSNSNSGAAPASVSQVLVPEGTRDALGLMYFLRTVDWTRTSEVRSAAFDGRRVYDVRVQAAGSAQNVTVAAGSFSATALSVRVFQDGNEMTNTRLKLWIAQDSARTPVLLEMELPIGTGRVELVKRAAGRE
jgi:hypothetical protein